MTSFESTPSQPRSNVVQQPELEGIDTNTRPMWIIAVLPLVGILTGLVPVPAGAPFRPNEPLDEVVLTLVSYALTLALTVVEILLAVADRRILIARGLIRPMHPGWALLDPVYVIGRSVVVRRRVRGSLRPLAVWIGSMVIAIVIGALPH